MLSLKIPLQSQITQGSIALAWIIFRLRFVMIGLVVIGLGILLGRQLTSPESAWPTISILVVFVALLVIIRNPLYGLLAWLFLDPFIETWIKVPMGAGIPDLSFARFTVGFMAIFMLAKGAVGKFRFVRLDLADVCIVATTIGIMISAPLAPEPTYVFQTAISLHFTPLVVYFFAKNLVRDKKDLHRLFWVIVLFGSVSAIYGIYEQATGQPLFVAKETLEGRIVAYTDTLRVIRGFIGSNNIGRVLTTSIPTAFYLFFESRASGWKNLLVGLLVIQTYGIFLTYNRTSWYGLLISLFIIQLFYPQFRKTFLVIVFIAAIVLSATWNQVNESDVVQNRINSKVSTLEKREVNWQTAYNMWQMKPVRGWGFGRYQQLSGRFRTDGGHSNINAIENDYLSILVSTGLIGFLPYLLFLLAPLINSLRLFLKARAPDWSGFIETNTISIYWAVISSFAIGSYTQIQTEAIVKMLPFAITGAVIGSHEYLLHSLKKNRPSFASHLPTPAAVE